MNAELLLAHYDRISDAPYALARLRKFILDLAVRGKLVDQNPDDEPAEKLLRRITKNRSKAIGHGSELAIRFTPSEPEPLNLPSNWTWARLGSICSKTGSGSTPRGGKSVYQQHGIPFLRSQNVYNDGLRLDDVAYIADETHERMPGTAVEPGDLLLNITGGSIGRCCLVPQKMGQANISQHVAIIRVAFDGIQYYLHELVLSPYFQSFVISEQTGAGRLGLPKNKMDLIPVALPPLSEQHRIVAKVDELMALCDRLEASRREQETRREQLTASAHYHLNSVEDAEELCTHAQFFISHLPRLTKRPDQIKQLRQTILNLAVRGKLVPQSRDDEPSAKLIKRMKALVVSMLRDSILRKTKSCRSFLQSEVPHGIPSSWSWAMLGEITDIGTGGTPSRTEARFWNGTIPWVTSGSTSEHVIDSCDECITEAAIQAHRLRIYQPGTLLVALYGQGKTRGQVAELGIPAAINQACAAIVSLPGFESVHSYLKVMLDKNYDEVRLLSAGGTQPNLNVQKIKEMLIPIPPLAEQHRIVAKVDELMALCDKLEASLSSAQTETSRLLESVLHHALEASA